MLRRLAAPAARLAQSKWQRAPPWSAVQRAGPHPPSLGFCTSTWCTQDGYTNGFELTFLGTSSQGGAYRNPSSLAVRLRGPGRCGNSQVWIFDAGEGCISQLQRSCMRVGAVRSIFITHVHGDHIFGLPGLVLSLLSRRQTEVSNLPWQEPVPPLRVYGPQGIRNFLRMALGVSASLVPVKNALQINEIFFPPDFLPPSFKHRAKQSYWKSCVNPLPYESAPKDFYPEQDPQHSGRYTYDLVDVRATVPDAEKSEFKLRYDGDSVPATVVAAPVLHTVPCLAYTLRENVISRRFDKDKLDKLGIRSSRGTETRYLFQAWLRGENAAWRGKVLTPADVMVDGRRARSLCVVGDTHDASGAAHIAQGVDVLVHEATNLAAQTHIARKRGHSSTRGATSFAKRVDAKRLLLNHSSVAYNERKLRLLECEARALFGMDRAYVARDLSVFAIPTDEDDDDNFMFRRFVGYARELVSGRDRHLAMNRHDLPAMHDDLLALPRKRTFDVQDAAVSVGAEKMPNLEDSLGGIAAPSQPVASLDAGTRTRLRSVIAATR